MKFTTSEAIEQVINRIELGLDEHSKWVKLWNTRAICHTSFPPSYLTETSHQECDFAKWFHSCQAEEWLHQVDFESISSVHRTMHEEARELAVKIQKGQRIKEEDYYTFVNSEWSFSQQLQRLKDKITRLQISFDPLTGIFNRQAMMPILLQEQAYVQRDGKVCCLAMADLDFFKNINDTYGHANGDIVLRRVADYLKSNLRPYDALFRYGGEEFLFCLPNTDYFTGKTLLDRLRSEIHGLPITLGNDEVIHISISLGIAQMQPGISSEDVVIRADEALYEAKNKGRNQVIAWEDYNQAD